MGLNLGYACINMELRKKNIYTGRTMIRRTFDAKGLPYVSELALANVRDLIEIIKWNYSKGIKVYRMSSSLFPWMSEYEFTDLPDYRKICILLRGVGNLAKNYGQRLSFHPGQFCVLASPKEKVVAAAINELNKAAQIMDLMGLPKSPAAKINIHVGGAYGDKLSAMERFCKNFKSLQLSAQARLTVENDDKGNMFGVKDLYNNVHKVIGVPIVFDFHHHKFCNPEGFTEEGALKLALSTWPEGIKPCTHYSESRREEKLDESIMKQAHSDYINKVPETYGLDFDCVVEAKAKEKSIEKFF
tara:strand:+ start:522 stop:1424 length:903 start_codon:yes stop_codon:yes gene_type:complete